MNVTRTNKADAPGAPAPDAVAPDPKALEAIGQALEAHYADLVQAPLPEKFADLLARLEVGVRVSERRGRRNALR